MVDTLLLGCGNIGRYIIKGFQKLNIDVAIADKNLNILNKFKNSYDTYYIDVQNKDNLKKLAKKFSWIITSLPGKIAYNTVKNLISLGVNIIDMSYYREDPWTLNKIAEQNKTVYVPDAGLAPGISNVLVGRICSMFDTSIKVDIYVGGLSIKPDNFLGLALTWSPADLVDEYIRPAKMILNGKIVSVDPLEYTGMIDIPNVGNFEFFASDGLRTLLTTFKKIDRLRELTLRYKGHLEKMRFLKNLGLLSNEKITINNRDINSPRLLSHLLEKRIENRYKDRVILYIDGCGNEKRVGYLMDKKYDKNQKMSAMSITTGATAVAILKLCLDGYIFKEGIYPPEYLGMDKKLFSAYLKILRNQGISIVRV